MDDNAQNPSVSTPTTQVPQPPVVPVASTPPPVAAPPVMPPATAQRPVEPPSAPRHPEQGPAPRVREVQTTPDEAEAASSVQASSDDSPDAPDTSDVAPEPEVQAKESHPDVEVPQELKEAGVEASDTKREQLLEERQQMEDAAPVDQAQLPGTAPVATQTVETLSQMDLPQAELAAKTEKQPRNGLSWIIREVLRWRKQATPPGEPPSDPTAPVELEVPEPAVTPPVETPKEGEPKS